MDRPTIRYRANRNRTTWLALSAGFLILFVSIGLPLILMPERSLKTLLNMAFPLNLGPDETQARLDAVVREQFDLGEGRICGSASLPGPEEGGGDGLPGPEGGERILSDAPAPGGFRFPLPGIWGKIQQEMTGPSGQYVVLWGMVVYG